MYSSLLFFKLCIFSEDTSKVSKFQGMFLLDTVGGNIQGHWCLADCHAFHPPWTVSFIMIFTLSVQHTSEIAQIFNE